jgi:hypothetical protein
VENKGVKLHWLGGIYFIPGSNKPLFNNMENLHKLVMERLGTHNYSEMTILPQPEATG